MSLSFPSSPTVGQLYPSPPISGAPVWKWDGSEWVIASANLAVAPVPRGYIDGLTLSTAGATNVFNVAQGVATDSTNTLVMSLPPFMNKTTGAWAAGSGNGALDTGTIAANTWYWVFLITNGSAVDVCITKAVAAGTVAPTLPSGYTYYRYIGSMLTNGSSQWVVFHQNGDEFLWDHHTADAAAAPPSSTNAVLQTLSIPLGVKVLVTVQTAVQSSGTTGQSLMVTSPDEQDQASFASGYGDDSTVYANVISGSNNFINQRVADIRSNTSGQIRLRPAATAASTGYWVYTVGWKDRRGRDN